MSNSGYIIERYRPDQDERWYNYMVYETRDHAERQLHRMNSDGNQHGRYYRLTFNNEVLSND